jgi:hypothetical protein
MDPLCMCVYVYVCVCVCVYVHVCVYVCTCMYMYTCWRYKVITEKKDNWLQEEPEELESEWKDP